MKVHIGPFRDLEGLDLTGPDRKVMGICIKLSSDVWTGTVDGEIACVWGVAPPSLLSEQAYLWLYTTDVIKGHQFTFVRHSQIVIRDLLKTYKKITGHCVVGQDHSVRWLRWLGATFEEPVDKLIPFHIRRKHG